MNDESSRIARKLTAAEAVLRIVAAPERGLVSAGAYYTGKAGMRAYGVRLIIGRAVSALSPGMCDIRNLSEIAFAARARFPRKQCVRFCLVGIEALPCSQAGAGRERDSIARCSPHNRSRVMAEHDFRYNLLNPAYTLTECRALAPGRYQVTGNGGSIRSGDVLIVTLKGSRDLSQRLTVDKVRHLINPPGQWTAMASGPVFRELAIHNWQVDCDSCGKQLDFEFAVDAKSGEAARAPAAEARIAELGWTNVGGRHLCPGCQGAQQ